MVVMLAVVVTGFSTFLITRISLPGAAAAELQLTSWSIVRIFIFLANGHCLSPKAAGLRAEFTSLWWHGPYERRTILTGWIQKTNQLLQITYKVFI